MKVKKETHTKTHRKIQISAQLVYVIAIAWLVAAIGCFLQQVGLLAIIFAAMGAIHLVWAVVADIRECKKK